MLEKCFFSCNNLQNLMKHLFLTSQPMLVANFVFVLYLSCLNPFFFFDQIPSERFASIRLSCRVFLPVSNQHHVLAQRQHRHLKHISLDSAGARIRSPAKKKKMRSWRAEPAPFWDVEGVVTNCERWQCPLWHHRGNFFSTMCWSGHFQKSVADKRCRGGVHERKLVLIIKNSPVK